MAMIELKHVARSFQHQVVLEDVSLQVEQGEMVCLFGPSGCGKTTLLEITAGILAPDRGSCRVDTDRIGYAFQDDVLIPWCSLRKNLEFIIPDAMSAEQACREMDYYLELMQLTDAADKCPAQVSGGMKRRLNLARSMLLQPELLLLDEPFAFQDDLSVQRILQCIHERHLLRGATVILVSHDVRHLDAADVRTISLSRSPVRINAMP
jgi:NitT/TauT family transport system ATP-binding protein